MQNAWQATQLLPTPERECTHAHKDTHPHLHATVQRALFIAAALGMAACDAAMTGSPGKALQKKQQPSYFAVLDWARMQLGLAYNTCRNQKGL